MFTKVLHLKYQCQGVLYYLSFPIQCVIPPMARYVHNQLFHSLLHHHLLYCHDLATTMSSSMVAILNLIVLDNFLLFSNSFGFFKLDFVGLFYYFPIISKFS
jgi:hypothetical protein